MASNPTPEHFLREAIELAVENVESGQGGPFAAIITKGNSLVSKGTNIVTTTDDPTAHAEITAIRSACEKLGDFHLNDCTLYSTCEPCPMCLGAIYWARIDRVVYAASRDDAAEAGFDDGHIYEEIEKPPSSRRIEMSQRLQEAALRPFDAWRQYDDRIEY